MWQDISDEMDRPEKIPGLPKPVKLNAWRAIAAVAIILIAVVLLFALPWGGGGRNGGETAIVDQPEEPPMVEIHDYDDDYELSIDTSGDEVIISMVKIDSGEEGS
jgi:hypothetical protein